MYFNLQRMLGRANNSSLAGHTKVVLLAIPANPKSWAHLVTPPFPILERYARRPKGMLDTSDLSPNPGIRRPSRTCATFAPTMSMHNLAILAIFHII